MINQTKSTTSQFASVIALTIALENREARLNEARQIDDALALLSRSGAKKRRQQRKLF